MLRRIKLPTIPGWMYRRLGFMVMVLFAAVIINFILPRLMPGDISDLYVSDGMPPEVAEQVRSQFGLDKPLFTQFLLYVKNTFTFQWGTSFYYRDRSVASLIGAALPRTLMLLIPAQLIMMAIGYLLGVIAGWKAGSKTDTVTTGAGLILWAMPMFWLAMIILYVGSYQYGWFPLGGYRTIGASYDFFGTIADRMYHMVLPTLAMVSQFGATQLVMRNTMTITLKQNYIMTARSKGLSENRVKHRHAARNALLPVVTSTAVRMALAVSGSIFVEQIFTFPGMGKLIFDSVLSSDYPVMQAAFLNFAIVVVITMFLLDLIYGKLDPRVRYD